MIKRIVLSLLASVFVVFAATSVEASVASQGTVFDQASLLTSDEVKALNTTLKRLRNTFDIDIVIVTAENTGSTSNYAERFYDHNGFGSNGILLLYCPDIREAYIDTVGECRRTFGKTAQNEIFDALTPYIRSDDYFGAFEQFTKYCENKLYSDRASTAVGAPKHKWYFTVLLGAVAIGIIIGFISVFVMRAKLKSVKFNDCADNYVTDGSLDIAVRRELYLYRTVTKTARPKQNSASSGGNRHSGSGRKF